MNDERRQKVLLMILDGFALSHEAEGNAVKSAKTPNLTHIFDTYPLVSIKSSGEDVGLPSGQMGNSEVGHLNIGAGRVVYQDLTRITKFIREGTFFHNPALLAAMKNVQKNASALHVMGLLGDGGVHSHIDHLKALLQMAKENNLTEVNIHCFMDGRDTAPKSGLGYIQELKQYIQEIGIGRIVSVSGRYYAMDRDKRYERIEKAYDAMVWGRAEVEECAQTAVEKAYLRNQTDEFISPVLIGGNKVPTALIQEKDSVVFYNFRPDRARELTAALAEKNFREFATKDLDLYFVCMTLYDASFQNVHVAFAPQVLDNTLGEVLSKNKVRQLRIAETEKYAHVTYFFNGGVEEPNDGEERILIPSPKVATYDLQPEMSAVSVTDTVIEKIKEDRYGFIALNYANCDMVGHTGVFEAAVCAVETVDEAVGRVVPVAMENGYDVLITSDHGNVEKMICNIEHIPFTAHTACDVFLTLVTPENNLQLQHGRLSDIAPTILALMQLEQPKEMTGKSLII